MLTRDKSRRNESYWQFFLSRVSTAILARNIDIAIQSVCPYVRASNHHIFSRYGSHLFLLAQY